MQSKGRRKYMLTLSISCIILLVKSSYSETDKLLQGQLLHDSENELVSASGKFRLAFFSPRFSTNRYLGIWYNRPPKDSGYYDPPLWVANRNTPIFDNSGRLTIDRNDGNLKILRDGGNPIAVSSVQGVSNTSAVLLQSGNLVLNEMNSDGSVRRVLWQSFDDLTDTLLPGMKLGINLPTGHKWFLQSWISDESPALGSFTLGMDPNGTNQLVIQSSAGGKVYWESGILVNGHFNFSDSENINNRYNFSYTLDENKTYFSYSVNEDVSSFPVLKIHPDGGLSSDGFSITPCGLFGECEGEKLLCGRGLFDFQIKWGNMSGSGFKFKDSDKMTLNECGLKCLNNCSCVAYAATNLNNNTGCEIWSKGAKFQELNSFYGRPISIHETKAGK